MNPQNQPNMTVKDWILIAVLAAIWGGSFLFGRILMLEWPPFTVVFLRVFLAAVALGIYLVATGRSFPLEGKFIGAIAVMGILNNVIPFSLILIGQQELGSSLASIVNAMTPIWTLIIANYWTTDEKLTTNKVFGIVFGFTGVAILMGADISAGLTASVFAQAAVLGATVSYGFAGVYGKRFKERDPIIVSTGQLIASSVIILPIALIVENPLSLSMPGPVIIGSILGLALLCTSVAYVLFFRILASAGATNLSLVTFLVPVTAILLGTVFLGEVLTTSNFIGMGFIAAGLALVDGRLFRHIHARFASF